MKRSRWISLPLALWLLSLAVPVIAQQGQPAGPVYIVQAGDTLGEIARRFGVSLDELIQTNNITNPNLLSEGDQLVIPGLEGIQGTLTTVSVPYGETLSSISRRYRIPSDMLARLNHLTSPEELYAGANLVIPQTEEATVSPKRAILRSPLSLLELAASQGFNPWAVMQANHFANSWSALPGDVLFLPVEGGAGPGGLPESIQSIDLQPLPLRQGKAGEIRLAAPPGLTLDGSYMDRPIHFFPNLRGVTSLFWGCTPWLSPASTRSAFTESCRMALTFPSPKWWAWGRWIIHSTSP